MQPKALDSFIALVTCRGATIQKPSHEVDTTIGLSSDETRNTVSDRRQTMMTFSDDELCNLIDKAPKMNLSTLDDRMSSFNIDSPSRPVFELSPMSNINDDF